MQQTKISIQPLRRLARGKGCDFLKRKNGAEAYHSVFLAIPRALL